MPYFFTTELASWLQIVFTIRKGFKNTMHEVTLRGRTLKKTLQFLKINLSVIIMQSANICIISHLYNVLSLILMLRHVQRKATNTCQALISVVWMLLVINHEIYDHCNQVLINTTNGWKELKEGTRNKYIRIFAQQLLFICAHISHWTRSKTKHGLVADFYWLFIRFKKKVYTIKSYQC